MNNPMLKSMKKKREKKKEREKDSPYFQIKGNHQRERVMIKGVQKIFRIRKKLKFHTLTQS
jgi:hypothetical protein